MAQSTLPVMRLSQHHVITTASHAVRLRKLVRVRSDALTTHCRQAGMSLELAEICAGLLASVVDDLVTASKLRRNDFERTKCLERVVAACQEPAASALRCAIAASPVNGCAAVAHWDKLCEPHDVGRVAWLLGMQSLMASRYAKRQEHWA